MRRPLAIAFAVVCVGYVFWQVAMTRSTTIRLEPSGYDLTYTMAWGWGMDEKISLARAGAVMSGPSSGWIEIRKRPYNAGLAVYRSVDDRKYYFGAGYKLFIFEPSVGVLRETCDIKDIPAYTALSTRLSTSRLREVHEAIDPEARHLFTYIEVDQHSGTVPPLPPDSRYYANLKYLGKIGLVRSGGRFGRGNEVRFVPADKAPEPRLSLGLGCG